MHFTDPADLAAIGAVPIKGLAELQVRDLLLSLSCDSHGQLEMDDVYCFLVLSEHFVAEKEDGEYDVVEVLPISTNDSTDTDPRTFVQRIDDDQRGALQLFRVPRRCSF